jgi:DNA-binding MarR family transcriptional regulator
MVRGGLVVRRACEGDRRGINCVLTPAGFELLDRTAAGHVGAVRTHLVDLLTDEEFAILGRVMERIAEGPGEPSDGPSATRPAVD